MTANEINQKYQEYIEKGWRYISDPTTWSGGCWIHEELGFVNKGGGKFSHITEAVEAMERFYSNMALIQS